MLLEGLDFQKKFDKQEGKQTLILLQVILQKNLISETCYLSITNFIYTHEQSLSVRLVTELKNEQLNSKKEKDFLTLSSSSKFREFDRN